jgi:hypothetical protein
MPYHYRLTELQKSGVTGIRRINDPVKLRGPVAGICGCVSAARQAGLRGDSRSTLMDAVVQDEARSSSKLYAAAKLLPPEGTRM